FADRLDCAPSILALFGKASSGTPSFFFERMSGRLAFGWESQHLDRDALQRRETPARRSTASAWTAVRPVLPPEVALGRTRTSGLDRSRGDGMRMFEEEAEHLARGVGPPWIGVGAGGAAARPGMARSVDDPPLENRHPACVGV